MDYEKEIPFGAFDSELMRQEISIPEGFEATIEGNKIILKKIESEDKTVINNIKKVITWYKSLLTEKSLTTEQYDEIFVWLEKQGEKRKITHEEICKSYGISDIGEFSDGYHTFNELYYYRMLYNAAFFNILPKEWVHKSKKHHDGEECFGGGWFIVMANLPTGQVSNHYELKDWDLFQIPEKETADEWDGHTPQEAADRLHKYLLEKQGEQKLPIEKLPEEMKTIGESLGFTTQKECDEYNKMVSDLIMSDGNEIKPNFEVGDTIRLKNSTAEYTIESISDGCYHGKGWSP